MLGRRGLCYCWPWRCCERHIRLFTTEDGLVRNWIRQIRRDSRGYLWGTFTTHDGLPSRLVNDVLEAADSEYWIATEAGVSRFHPSASNGNGYFENFRIDPSDDSSAVAVLFQDSAKDIWAGTGGGLYRLLRADGTSHGDSAWHTDSAGCSP